MNEVQNARKELMDTIIRAMKGAEERNVPMSEVRDLFEGMRRSWDKQIPL
jgi:hypothetical protein